MPDENGSKIDQSLAQLDLERRLLADLDVSSKRLTEIYTRLEEVQKLTFDIAINELKEIDQTTQKPVISAERAVGIYHRLADAVSKTHRLQLDQINTLHGIRKNAEVDLGDDLIDGEDDDLSDEDRRGAMKAVKAYFKKTKLRHGHPR